MDSRLSLRFALDAHAIRAAGPEPGGQTSPGQARAKTRLHLLVQDPPQRVIRAFNDPQDGAALVHLHNLSGGVLGGDRLYLDVTVEPHARGQITTTGATRVYRRRTGHDDAQQETRLMVRTGGLLEYLPDSLIPFAHAGFVQQTHIELAHDAGLIYWECVAPGRVAAQEVFAYDRLQMGLSIYAQGQPIALEQYELLPAVRPLQSTARLGSYLYFGSIYLCRVGIGPEQWARLAAELGSIAQQQSLPDEIIWGVSPLSAHGLVIRVAARRQQAIDLGQTLFRQHAKQALYGIDAHPPRKLY